MNKLFVKYRYALLKIDVTDTYVFADIFDDDKYLDCICSNNIEKLLDYLMINFNKDNPAMETYSDWEKHAEDGATEYELVFPRGTIFRSSLLLKAQITGAIRLIRKYHGNRKRKGDNFSELEHSLEVGYKLWKNKFPIDVVVAGFCHDLLEDTECSEKEIEKACGKEVLKIVCAVSNDKNLSDKRNWEKKKEKYVKSVEAGGKKAIAVSTIDKICNLHSLFDQYEREGSKLWKRFNRGKEKKLWFNKEVLAMARRNWKHSLIDELEVLVKKLEENTN